MVKPGQPVAALKVKRTIGPFTGPCRELRYAEDGHLIFLSGLWKAIGDWSIAVVDPAKNLLVRTRPIPPPGYCGPDGVLGYMLSVSADARLVAFSPRTKFLMYDHDETIQVWDLAAKKELCSLPFPTKGPGRGTLSPQMASI